MLFADHRGRPLGDRFRQFLDGIELGDLCLRLGNCRGRLLKLLVGGGLSRSLEERTQRRAVPARQVALGIAEGLQVGNPGSRTSRRAWMKLLFPTRFSPTMTEPRSSGTWMSCRFRKFLTVTFSIRMPRSLHATLTRGNRSAARLYK